MAIDPNNSSGGVYVSYVVCEKKKNDKKAKSSHIHIFDDSKHVASVKAFFDQPTNNNFIIIITIITINETLRTHNVIDRKINKFLAKNHGHENSESTTKKKIYR